MTQTISIEHKEAARPEQCRTFNNRYLLVLANHNILILNKRDQKIEGLGVDPNPSFFLPLYFDSHNSTNCTSTTYVTISILVNYHPLLTHLIVPGNLQALMPNALQCNVIPGNLDYTGIYIRYRIHLFIKYEQFNYKPISNKHWE